MTPGVTRSYLGALGSSGTGTGTDAGSALLHLQIAWEQIPQCNSAPTAAAAVAAVAAAAAAVVVVVVVVVRW